MRVAFITVGDTRRLTGGYLYHARVFAALRERGIALDEVVASGASLAEQRSRAAAFGAEFDPRPFDVVVVDALARAVCAPWLDRWRALRPLVAMIHELPSVAATQADEPTYEVPLLRADLLIAVSAHGRAILEERGVPPERVRIVSPGCDRLPIAERGRGGEPRSSILHPPSSILHRRVLCVAQWIRRKGILALVRAWASQPQPGALLELVGETEADPAYAAEVRAAIARAPADAAILVRGAVDDATLAEAYRGAALFVLPSTYEGYGMAYAEALAYGLPVIACDVGPVPELIGAAGWLVPPDAPESLAEALDRLLADAGLRARLSRESRARAASLPTWEDTTRGFQQVLEEAVTGRR